MNWKNLVGVIGLACLSGCATSPGRFTAETDDVALVDMVLSEEQRYFLEVALGSEFGNADPLIRRWERPLRLTIEGDTPEVLLVEAQTVVDELRELVPQLDIRWVEALEDANVHIFFGPYKEYASRYAPRAAQRLRRNWGYFTVQWFANRQGIERASLYVDTHRARDDDQRRHLLREELTQVLGLMADSKRYPDSIFYQHWSTTTAYSELDKQLIKMLYSDDIHSGMGREALLKAWGQPNVGQASVSGSLN